MVPLRADQIKASAAGMSSGQAYFCRVPKPHTIGTLSRSMDCLYVCRARRPASDFVKVNEASVSWGY